MSERAYGYWNLNLFDGKISLPLKFHLSTEPDKPTSNLIYGYKGQKTQQLYVIPKELGKNIENIDDILEIAHSKEYYNSEFKKISEIPELNSLLNEYKEKKKCREIEVLAIKEECPPLIRYNGKHYTCIVGSPLSKVPSAPNLQIYQSLLEFLSNKYMHIRYFNNCSTAQEIGVMYADNGIIRISGLYADEFIRKTPDVLGVPIQKEIKEIFSEKLNKFYTETSKVNIYELDWYNYYKHSLESNGVVKKTIKKVEKCTHTNNDNLMNLLNGI
jgi:hypothetical protein